MRTRREWGHVLVGMAVGFALGEARMAGSASPAINWIFASLNLLCLVLGFILMAQRPPA